MPIRPTSLGKGEQDILIATKGVKNEILLGSFKTDANPKAEPFYVGEGDALETLKHLNQPVDLVLIDG